MTVRLDATEKLVIHCTEHVRDGQLVDPAVPSRLLRRSSESRHGRGLDVRGQRQSTSRTTQVPRTRCAKRQQHGIHPVVICPAIRARAAYIMRLLDDSSVATWSVAVSLFTQILEPRSTLFSAPFVKFSECSILYPSVSVAINGISHWRSAHS